MILVDTSVWIDHINASDPVLVSLLAEERVLTHSDVIGEISLGSLRDRDVVLGALLDLPRAPIATPVWEIVNKITSDQGVMHRVLIFCSFLPLTLHSGDTENRLHRMTGGQK